ncbi:unnamed protein product [Periconia digitata]|uniref:Uncharacterized protein n=1 Tax=Periconia digitata TaxID=1303443 RepID=A0A9W4UK79_9PLEO|nr:unnamed protein product [Periconia digitata]
MSSPNTVLFSRLEAELTPLVKRILDVLSCGKPIRAVEPRALHDVPFNPETVRSRDILAQDEVEFFVICHDSRESEKMFKEKSAVAEKHQKAAITYNRCRHAAVALKPALDLMFHGMKILNELVDSSFYRFALI